jgi:hypothetical protein
MNIRHIVHLASVVLLGISWQPINAAPIAVRLNDTATEWTFSHEGTPVMVYSVDPQQYKPYVKKLYAFNGRNLLRDAPFDHLHHHALMYGIKVNGLNFWEEIAGSGVQKVVETGRPRIGTSKAGLPQASISQEIYWLAPGHAFLPDTNAPALLIERRTITLTLDIGRQEVALEWHARFQAGKSTNEVVLTGSNYHGLGMRFVEELDAVAAQFTPDGSPDLSGTRQDVSRHKWQAVSFDQGERPAAIVLAGNPANARGDSWFFSMKQPFAYLSATQNLDQEPLRYRAGEVFEIGYLVLVYPRVMDATTISKRVQEWAGTSNQ